jgi:N-acetylglucosamine kinase-like BadF-type ATPase
MSLFLGVDGGQTTTRVVLADEKGRILSQATGGPSNHTEEPGGPERLERVIRTTVSSALGAAGAPPLETAEFAAACFGMTGETEIKLRILSRFIRTPELRVVHDSVNALAAATAGDPGVMVIGGTGSVARGVNSQGREMRVGGWAHIFGDEGSAYWIGREAVRAIVAESDGFGEKTQLTPVLLERLGVPSPVALMANYYSGKWSHDHLAGLSVWVDEVAQRGDQVARSILQNAGRLLAQFASYILTALFPASSATEVPDGWKTPIVACIGGVFKNDFTLTAFREAVLAKHPRVEIRPPLLPPVLGSLLLAYRSTGSEVPRSVRDLWPDALTRLPDAASGGTSRP